MVRATASATPPPATRSRLYPWPRSLRRRLCASRAPLMESRSTKSSWSELKSSFSPWKSCTHVSSAFTQAQSVNPTPTLQRRLQQTSLLMSTSRASTVRTRCARSNKALTGALFVGVWLNGRVQNFNIYSPARMSDPVFIQIKQANASVPDSLERMAHSAEPRNRTRRVLGSSPGVGSIA